jgi:NAD(P)-dependent dehydrogenase (short-subunit alcohol dehydrogenase family)
VQQHTHSLTSVIVNAAILLGFGKIEDLTSDVLLAHLEANVIGPHNILRAFSPFLTASGGNNRSIVLINSRAGSVSSQLTEIPLCKTIFGMDFFPLGSYSISK